MAKMGGVERWDVRLLRAEDEGLYVDETDVGGMQQQGHHQRGAWARRGAIAPPLPGLLTAAAVPPPAPAPTAATRNLSLTVAEAALLLTNAQSGTNVTMADLRTARLMVGLWDCEDRFEWTVGW